jgi:hypothetical protein
LNATSRRRRRIRRLACLCRRLCRLIGAADVAFAAVASVVGLDMKIDEAAAEGGYG